MSADFEGPTPTDRFQESVLQTYSEGDRDFEQELIDSYKQSVSDHLPKLTRALKDSDLPNSVLYSHDIKGASSYIGAEAVRFLSGKIEALCKQKDLKPAVPIVTELQKEVKEVFKLLDKYMGKEPEEEEEDQNKEEQKKEEQKEKEPEKEHKEDLTKGKDKEKKGNIATTNSAKE
jgi:histidine phosphotransfer protein HptB